MGRHGAFLTPVKRQLPSPGGQVRERRMSVVDNAIYVDGKRSVVPDSLDQTFEALHACPAGGHSFGWIGMFRPDEAEIRAVAKEFNLHSLSVEDTINAHQ